MEEDIIKAREEGIRIGAELAAMHGSDATSQELEKAFFDGCEVGYKKASEELQLYIDLYKDLAEKAEKVAREIIDKYPKWIPLVKQKPKKNGEYFVSVVNVEWRTTRDTCIAIWSDDHFYINNFNAVTHWMPLPEPPKESEKDG